MTASIDYRLWGKPAVFPTKMLPQAIWSKSPKGRDLLKKKKGQNRHRCSSKTTKPLRQPLYVCLCRFVMCSLNLRMFDQLLNNISMNFSFSLEGLLYKYSGSFPGKGKRLQRVFEKLLNVAEGELVTHCLSVCYCFSVTPSLSPWLFVFFCLSACLSRPVRWKWLPW